MSDQLVLALVVARRAPRALRRDENRPRRLVGETRGRRWTSRGSHRTWLRGARRAGVPALLPLAALVLLPLAAPPAVAAPRAVADPAALDSPPSITAPAAAAAGAGPLRVAASIAPAAYFVERIGGPRVRVEVMVPPGVEEETYSPSPRQLAELLRARLYVAVGHPAFPLESRSLLPLLVTHPEIRVVSMSRGVELIPMGDPPAAGGSTDPHVWTAPGPVAIAAVNIANGLAAVDPARRAVYAANLAAFERDLQALDAAFRRVAAGPRPVRFISYHPAWGYLAHQYGFRQIPVEAGGKEPGTASLIALAAAARRDGVHLLLVPAGLPNKLTASLASAIGGKALAVDYMARDWLAMMWRLAAALAEVAHD
jgi:zinc transport system substrate-binding protein